MKPKISLAPHTETITSETTRISPISTSEEVKKTVNTILMGSNAKALLMGKLNEVPDFSRVYLLRHLDVDQKEFTEYSELRTEWNTNKGKMSEDRKNRMDFLDNYMEIKTPVKSSDKEFYGSILGKDCILYADLDEQIKTRNKRTLEWIHESFVRTGLVQCEIRRHDLYSNKQMTYGETTLNTASQLSQINEEIKQQLQTTPGSLRRRNIIILSNSSFAHSFHVLGGNRDVSPQEGSNTFRNQDYDYFDIDPSGNPIKNDDIQVTPSNYKSICEFFCIEKGELTLIQIQNGLNNFLKEMQDSQAQAHLSILEKMLYSGQENLRIYAIKGLIKYKPFPKLHFLKEFFFGNDCVTLSMNERMLILKHAQSDKEVEKLFREFFIKRDNLWENNQTQIEEYFGKDYYGVLKFNQDTYQEAVDFQINHSLDEMIQDQKNDAVLVREVFFWGEWGELREGGEHEEIKGTSRYKNYIDISKILHDGGKYILRANVGEGKSFWLTEFVKYASTQDRMVRFYRASDFSENNNKIDTFFEDAQRQGIVLCIDAIDEITTDNKDYIKGWINKFQGTCIITTRKGEYSEENKSFTTLMLKPLEADDFLKSRFTGDKIKQVHILNLLKEKYLDIEIEGNPLLLMMVVLLAKLDDETRGIYQAKYGIKSLEDIYNKADLYESIVRFILVKHKGKAINPALLAKQMEYLNLFAYGLSQGKTTKDILEENPVLAGELESISLLNKRNGDFVEFEFVHHSFQGFFLARYFLIHESNHFPHNINKLGGKPDFPSLYINCAKDFYADLQEGKNQIFVNLIRNYGQGLLQIIEGKIKDKSIVSLYLKELGNKSLDEIIFYCEIIGPIISDNSIVSKLIETIVKKQKTESCSMHTYTRLLEHYIAIRTEEEKDYMRNEGFFSINFLSLIPNDAALLALPKYVFKRKQYKGSLEHISIEVENKLYRNIARIGTPIALSLLKEHFSIEDNYNKMRGLLVFIYGTQIIKEWFLSQLNPDKRKEFLAKTHKVYFNEFGEMGMRDEN